MSMAAEVEEEPTFTLSCFDDSKCKYRYTKKTGYLTKSPRGRNLKLGRWQRRWFMLVESVVNRPGTIPERYIWFEYFKMPTGSHNKRNGKLPVLKGVLDLRTCIAVVASDKPVKGNEYVFNVVTKSKVHYFAAQTEEERQEWITALNEFLFSKNVEPARSYLTQDRVVPAKEVSPSSYLDCVTSNTSFHRRFTFTNPRQDCANRFNLEPKIEPVLSRKQTDSETDDTAVLNEAGLMGYYEEPRKDECALHIQLAGLGVTNIPRHQVIADGQVPSQGKFLYYKVKWISSTHQRSYPVLLKMARESDSTTNLLQEAAVLAQLYHPNVVKLFGVILVGKPKMTVVELCAKGDLKSRLQSLKSEVGGSLTSDRVKFGDKLYVSLLDYCRQITLGMHYLSERGFVHRSLMAKYILVSEDDTCKISGFDNSIALEGTVTFLTNDPDEFLLKWTAPEVFVYGNYSTASTVWSLGIVMYEIWGLGDEPYTDCTHCNASQVIQRINSGYRLPPPQGCPKAIKDVMTCCWHRNPERRPDYSSLVGYLLQHESYLLDLEFLNSSPSEAPPYKNFQELNNEEHETSTSPTQHTDSQPSYYNTPSLVTSKPASLPEHHQEQQDSDEDDYTTDMSTIIGIRNKSFAAMLNRGEDGESRLLPRPSTTTMSGRWTHFFLDNDNESSQESEGDITPHQDEFTSLATASKPPLVSPNTLPPRHLLRTQYHSVGHSESMSRSVSPPYYQNGITDDGYELTTPTRLMHSVSVPEYRTHPSADTASHNGPILPAVYSGAGFALSSDTGTTNKRTEKTTLESKSDNPPATKTDTKPIKPPVAAPRKRSIGLQKFPVDTSPSVTNRTLTPSPHVHSDIKRSPVEDTNHTLDGTQPQHRPTARPRHRLPSPPAHTYVNVPSSDPDVMYRLTHHRHSSGYEYIQPYELLTHTMSIEEYMRIAQTQRTKRLGRYLSL